MSRPTLIVTSRALGDGATETTIRDGAGEVVAVITHPMRRAKWFLHRADLPGRGMAFRSLRAAVAAAENLTREAAENAAENAARDLSPIST